jgi:hypothetical protein
MTSRCRYEDNVRNETKTVIFGMLVAQIPYTEVAVDCGGVVP